MTTQQVPSIGRVLHYTLSAQVAEQINRRRQHASEHRQDHIDNANGVQIHVGNQVKEGDVFPLIVTKVWGPDPTSAFNGQLLLDGNDLFWVTSTNIGEGVGKCAWPVFVPPAVKAA